MSFARSIAKVSAVLCVLVPAFSAVAQDHDTKLRSATKSFTIQLNASPAATVPLFGPVRETEWSPEWTPTFLHPATPAQVEGAVFMTEGKQGPLTWLLSTYDEKNGQVCYEVLAPGYAMTRISIKVISGHHPNTSVATVTYRRMALSSAANPYVDEFEHHFESQGNHWETAINGAIKVKGLR